MARFADTRSFAFGVAVTGLIARAFSVLALFIGLQIAVADDGFEGLPAPEPGTYETILATKSETVRVFAYPARQPVFVIDFPTLAQQGRMFNRIVALIERIGVGRARVLDDQELAQFIRSLGKTELTFAFGNDFLVHELVVFFNLAEYGGIALNQEERALRAFLLEQGLIRERFGFLQAMRPNAVILSIPQEKTGGGKPAVSALARRTILMHELSHAEYYTNPLYRDWCQKFWHETLSKRQRAALRTFLTQSGYDPDNEELMINEAQAYLLHTPDPRAFNAKMANLTEAELEAIRQAFLKGYPDALLAKR
ncbi:hypothetical protein [Sulfuricystis multivorans]|uniref:hypothetical protein n=1 Tax=Sulfuricystis multivorans TaxID=2211108 RepID=UPI000F824849|nr:hypothetical protein [Sulfuricystis multivorans]